MNRKENAFSHFITIYSSHVSASVPIGSQFIFLKLNIYSILFYPITLEGRQGTTDEFAAIPFHFVLFSAALVELPSKKC